MKAAVYEAIERIVVRDVPEPTIEEGGVLVKVDSCAVCGSDIRTFFHGHRHVNPPQIIGHEVTGTVIETLSNAYIQGDRVQVAPAISCGTCEYCRLGLPNMCDNRYTIGYHSPGGFAEFMAVPAEAVKMGNVNRVPEELSLEEATIAEPLACCINGQELTAVSLGDTVVVIGAGPIGCLHVALARSRGATRVVLTDLNRTRLEAASRAVQPNDVIDPSVDLHSAVMDITNGKGADVIIIAASSYEAQEAALSLVGKMGRICFFAGLPSGSRLPVLDSNLLHYKQVRVLGSFSSSPRQNRLALELLATGRIPARQIITSSVPLSGIERAIAASRDPSQLKIVVKP